jgi:hypothetical protein
MPVPGIWRVASAAALAAVAGAQLSEAAGRRLGSTHAALSAEGGHVFCPSVSNASEVLSAVALCDCDGTTALLPSQVDWWIGNDPSLVGYWYAMALIALAVVVLNLSLIVGVARDVELHKTHNWLVCGQALCDLTVGLLISVHHFGTLWNGNRVLGGAVGCAVYGYSVVAACNSTTWSLALIAYSRKVRVLDNCMLPGRRLAAMYVAIVWGGSLLLALFLVLNGAARLTCSSSFCNPVWNYGVMVATGLAFFAPIAYVVAVYWRIWRKLQASRARMRSLQRDTCLPSEEHLHSSTTNLMLLMTGAVLATWTPLYIYILYGFAKWALGYAPAGFDASEFALGLGANISSLTSPVIYGLQNGELKFAMLYAFAPSLVGKREAQSSLQRSKLQRKVTRLHLERPELLSAGATHAGTGMESADGRGSFAGTGRLAAELEGLPGHFVCQQGQEQEQEQQEQQQQHQQHQRHRHEQQQHSRSASVTETVTGTSTGTDAARRTIASAQSFTNAQRFSDLAEQHLHGAAQDDPARRSSGLESVGKAAAGSFLQRHNNLISSPAGSHSFSTGQRLERQGVAEESRSRRPLAGLRRFLDPVRLGVRRSTECQSREALSESVAESIGAEGEGVGSIMINNSSSRNTTANGAVATGPEDVSIV